MAICKPRGIELDWEQYTPLISWFPTVSRDVKDSTYDLYASSFTDVLQAGGWTINMPWVAEIAELTTQDTLKLPADVAARFHTSDRFVVWVEGDALCQSRMAMISLGLFALAVVAL